MVEAEGFAGLLGRGARDRLAVGVVLAAVASPLVGATRTGEGVVKGHGGPVLAGEGVGQRDDAKAGGDDAGGEERELDHQALRPRPSDKAHGRGHAAPSAPGVDRCAGDTARARAMMPA